MKAISLHQPWASFVANGAKRVETRGKDTKYRGSLVIHAAKKWTKGQEEVLRDLNMLLMKSGREDLILSKKSLPLGQAVALVELASVIWMTDEWIASRKPLEKKFGIYRPGRFAWILRKVQPLDGIPMPGHQWLWTPDPLVQKRVRGAVGSC